MNIKQLDKRASYYEKCAYTFETVHKLDEVRKDIHKMLKDKETYLRADRKQYMKDILHELRLLQDHTNSVINECIEIKGE